MGWEKSGEGEVFSCVYSQCVGCGYPQGASQSGEGDPGSSTVGYRAAGTSCEGKVGGCSLEGSVLQAAQGSPGPE